MNAEDLITLREALATAVNWSPNGWLYLPADKKWNLDSKAAILESDEVPPELEDEPDAGVPEFAKRNGLIQVLPAAAVQDVIENARAQKKDATEQDFFKAFEFYYKHDAFMEFAGDE